MINKKTKIQNNLILMNNLFHSQFMSIMIAKLNINKYKRIQFRVIPQWLKVNL